LRFTQLIIIALLACMLQSCMTAATTAVVGGVLIYKRKAIEDVATDQLIKSQIENEYFQNGELWQQNRVIVSSVNGNVLLTGETRTAALKQTALELAQQVPHVNKIYNEITVSTPVSILQQTKDSLITFIIKMKMLGALNFDPSAVKVITNNNTVYLMGIVDPIQADHAAQLASTTTGVQKVVKVFQYIT
jgi:osmotically-inducible protein OsmY